MGWLCRNSILVTSESLARCNLCRLSPTGGSDRDYWVPTDDARRNRTKHPVIEAEKREERIGRMRKKQQVKKERDRSRVNVGRQAASAEKRTERNIIQATKNSGRSHMDGDHLSAGQITLDTKHQSLRANPIVLLSELEKVRGDAVRAGAAIGGLVLRNKNNVGVVVFAERDYARIADQLRPRDTKEEA